jgi:phage host-nuclease inhibitor protein Gam
MLTQRRPRGGPIKRPRTWADVDNLIDLLTRIEAEIERLKAVAEERDRRQAADLRGKLSPLGSLADDLRRSIERFASAGRRDFGRWPYLRLPHGRIGWRPVVSVVKLLRPREEVVEALERLNLAVAIMATKRPSKEMLATFPRKLLAEIGVSVVHRRPFFIEFNGARPSRDPRRRVGAEELPPHPLSSNSGSFQPEQRPRSRPSMPAAPPEQLQPAGPRARPLRSEKAGPTPLPAGQPQAR